MFRIKASQHANTTWYLLLASLLDFLKVLFVFVPHLQVVFATLLGHSFCYYALS